MQRRAEAASLGDHGAAPRLGAAAAVARTRAADYIAAGYNLVLTIAWGALLTRESHAPLLFLAHASAVAMPWLIIHGSDRLTLVGRWLREVYPLIWLLPFWTELDFLRTLLHATAYDGPIAALDRVLFGTNIDAVWIWRMSAVWFSEAMHLLYFTYYPALVLPLLYVGFSRRWLRLRDFTLRVTLAYFSCYLIYIAFPVDGPHFLALRYDGALTEGFFYQLVGSFQGAGDSMGASFPSSHVVGGVTMAYLGWRWFPRGVAMLMTLSAIGVAVSAVYSQNHYAIDALAGIVWALLLQVWVAPLLSRDAAGGGRG